MIKYLYFVILIPFCITSQLQRSEIYALVPLTDRENVIGGSLYLKANEKITFQVIGRRLRNDMNLTFTTVASDKGSDCSLGTYTQVFTLSDIISVNIEAEINSAKITVSLSESSAISPWYYVCFSEVINVKYQQEISTAYTESGSESSSNDLDNKYNNSQAQQPSFVLWVHQGPSIRIHSMSQLMPLWLNVILVVLLLSLSALFSGLTLGFMSLDPTELTIIKNSGSEREKRYAETIIPVRQRGNFLLCTLIFGNVSVNSTLTVLLDSLGGGIIAVIASTLSIVILGEIVPQAVCSRKGMVISANTIWLTKIFMVLTFPLSFPMSLILDKILGKEIGVIYNREKLAELLKHGTDKHDIKRQELNILHGALQLTKKTAADCMTSIDDVYMIEYNAILDFETMSSMLNAGYTRVPIYENNRLNIVALLNIKDLAFIDPDDKIPLKTVCKFYNNPIVFVFEDTRLDLLLEEFKKGQSHLAFVNQAASDQQPNSPYNTIGIVTLEDVIEEIIQSEILDEKDAEIQTKRKKLISRRKDFTVFSTCNDAGKLSELSPQLALACFQFLQTTVEPFREVNISSSILKRLLKQDIYIQYKYSEKSKDHMLYEANKPADYFIIILQGKCLVDIGKDHIKFEAGPFYYFGADALYYPENKELTSMHSLTDKGYSKGLIYVPDYSVSAIEDLEYIRLWRDHYIAACRATLMERKQQESVNKPLIEEDPFLIEWKLADQLVEFQSDREESSLTLPIIPQWHRVYSEAAVYDIKNQPQREKHSLSSEIQPKKTIIYPDQIRFDAVTVKKDEKSLQVIESDGNSS